MSAEMCGDCGGTGRVEHEWIPDTRCRACNGRGAITDQDEDTGKVGTARCLACGGSGSVPAAAPPTTDTYVLGGPYDVPAAAPANRKVDPGDGGGLVEVAPAGSIKDVPGALLPAAAPEPRYDTFPESRGGIGYRKCPTCGSTDRAERPFVSYHYGPCANAWHSVEEGKE